MPKQLNILKFGLTYSNWPPKISTSIVYTCLELIHHTMAKNLKYTKLVGKLSPYRPSAANLKKHNIVKELRKNKNVVV